MEPRPARCAPEPDRHGRILASQALLIADPHRRMALQSEMLFGLISAGLIDSLEESGEALVDCDAFLGSTDVAAGVLIIHAVVV